MAWRRGKMKSPRAKEKFPWKTKAPIHYTGGPLPWDNKPPSEWGRWSPSTATYNGQKVYFSLLGHGKPLPPGHVEIFNDLDPLDVTMVEVVPFTALQDVTIYEIDSKEWQEKHAPYDPEEFDRQYLEGRMTKDEMKKSQAEALVRELNLYD